MNRVRDLSVNGPVTSQEQPSKRGSSRDREASHIASQAIQPRPEHLRQQPQSRRQIGVGQSPFQQEDPLPGPDLSGLPSLSLVEMVELMTRVPEVPQLEKTLKDYKYAARHFESFLECRALPDEQPRVDGRGVLMALKGPPPMRAAKHPAVMAYVSQKAARRKAGQPFYDGVPAMLDAVVNFGSTSGRAHADDEAIMKSTFGRRTDAGRGEESVTSEQLAVRALLRFLGGPLEARLARVLDVMRNQIGVLSAKDYPLFQQAKAWIEADHPHLAPRLYPAIDALAEGQGRTRPRVIVSETNKPFIEALGAATGSQDISSFRQIAAFLQRRHGAELAPEEASMQFLIDHFGAKDYDWNGVDADPFVVDLKADPLVPKRTKERIASLLKTFVDATLDMPGPGGNSW